MDKLTSINSSKALGLECIEKNAVASFHSFQLGRNRIELHKNPENDRLSWTSRDGTAGEM